MIRLPGFYYKSFFSHIFHMPEPKKLQVYFVRDGDKPGEYVLLEDKDKPPGSFSTLESLAEGIRRNLKEHETVDIMNEIYSGGQYKIHLNINNRRVEKILHRELNSDELRMLYFILG